MWRKTLPRPAGSARRALIGPAACLLLVLAHPAEAEWGGSAGRARRDGSTRPQADHAVADSRGGAGNGVFAPIAQQLEEVEQRLQLQPEQQPLWDRYARRVMDLIEDQTRGPRAPAASESQDALKRIAQQVDIVRDRLAAMEQIEDAAGRLYRQLTPEQRQIADGLLPGTVPPLYSGLAQDRRSAAGGPGGGPGGEAGSGDRAGRGH